MRDGGTNSSRNTRRNDTISVITDLVDLCVHGFLREISGQIPDTCAKQISDNKVGKRACLDMYMRDQVIVFEALGEVCQGSMPDQEEEDESSQHEDESCWTLHTKTAKWVCHQMLQKSSSSRVN